MQRIRFFIIALLISSLPLCSYGQERTHNIVIEDYFSIAYLQQLVASPDGKSVAFVQIRWDKQKDGKNRDIWVLDLESREPQRLTFDQANETSPQWAPDNQTVYFLGRYKHEGEKKPPYDGKTQVWKIQKDGSELKPVTSIKGGISDFQLSEDGKSLYYIIQKDHLIDEWKELRSEYKDDLKFGHGIQKVSEIWKLDLVTWRTSRLLDHNRFIREFKVTPDEKKIALISDPDEPLIYHEGGSVVEILIPATGELFTLKDKLWREKAPSPNGWLGNLAWSSDSRLLGFSVDFDGYPMEILAGRIGTSANDSKVRKLKRPKGVSASGALQWIPGKDELCFIGEMKARHHIYSLPYPKGKAEALVDGDLVVEGYSLLKNGNTVTIQSGLTYYHDLFLHRKGESAELLWKNNAQIDTWILPQISIVSWKGANGDPVEGILELPPDYNNGEKLPLIVNLHGGPTASEQFSFLFWIYGRTALAARGYAVLSPNYRGSTGYGDKFLSDLVGHENDYDVKDILAGVDAMIDRGIADPNRLGVMGWSNGGYLTNCLIATNRFDAASSGAGVLDMTIQWADEDTPGHVYNFMKGLPWEQPEHYQKTSPLYSFKPGLKTATLIHVGEKDPRVPAIHSKALHRALYNYLDVPCELLIYPGEPHGLTTYQHRLAKMRWDHAWFDKYVPLDK